MIITNNIAEIRQIRWAAPSLTWGFVPTMGFLHEGHLSLMRRAKAENERVAVSIYVNPTQFAPTEDLGSYPRNLEQDVSLLTTEGVDLLFMPSDGEMYPERFQTAVILSELTRPLEGASRPTHFQGVATVVAKLFNIIQPTKAYFGQKDAQQTVVIRQMVHDLNFNLDVVVCPTMREADGLAMSSRNAYLNPAQRQAAAVLFRALQAAKTAFVQGERDGRTLRHLMRDVLAAEPLARLEYVSVAHPLTLVELDEIENEALLSLAVVVGKTRLIDNLLLPE